MDSISQIPFRFVAYLLTIGAQTARAFDALKVGNVTDAIIEIVVMLAMLGLIWAIYNLTIKRREPS